MNSYSVEEYIDNFGLDMFNEKVKSTLDHNDDKIDSIYATDSGNIFMIIKSEEF